MATALETYGPPPPPPPPNIPRVDKDGKPTKAVVEYEAQLKRWLENVAGHVP
jgi:hypothetical protein